jgi:cytochrome c oxidase subunit 2
MSVSGKKICNQDGVMGIRRAAKVLMSGTLAAVFLLWSPGAPAGQTPRRIEVLAKRFAFSPAEISLKKGEPVVLVFKSADVTHGIKFDELDAQTEIHKGTDSELALTPKETGDFVGHCTNFCGEGHGSMALTLHVTE